MAAELASADGTLGLRCSASCVDTPGFLAAYFDPAAITGGEAAAAEGGAAAAEAELQEEALALEEEEAGTAAAQRRLQQEAARAAAAAALAAMRQGDKVKLLHAEALEHETRPPPRYNEGAPWGALRAGVPLQVVRRCERRPAGGAAHPCHVCAFKHDTHARLPSSVPSAC